MNRTDDIKYSPSFKLKLALCVLLLFPSVSARGFDFETTRSKAMGGVNYSTPDDASILMMNPAGLAGVSALSLYLDYSENDVEQVKASVILPLQGTGLGFAWARNGLNREYGEFISAGVGRRLFSGAPDTYLDVGFDIRLVRSEVTLDSECASCGVTKMSDSDITGDMGISLRPFPVVSFRFIGKNIREIDLYEGESAIWRRKAFFGVTIHLREKLSVSWERDLSGSGASDRYGFLFRTVLPLELMAGFINGSACGGARAIIGPIRFSLAFSPDGEDGVETLISTELINGDRREAYQ